MKVVLIGGEKGGTGKSTISTNMAVMAALSGYDVILLDTDKQGSSSKFMDYRKERAIQPIPSCVQIRGKYINTEIENFAKKYQLVIIDAGGKDSVELRSAMACQVVSHIYSPLQPSEFDLETLSTMDELVYLSQSYNPNLKAFIIFNQAPTHSKITVTEEAKEYTSTFENISICDTILSHRVPIQYATSKAQSVVEFEFEKLKAMPSYQAKKYSPKASMELCSLYREIFGHDFKALDILKFSNIKEVA
jgi:chromosome partitioning protein